AFRHVLRPVAPPAGGGPAAAKKAPPALGLLRGAHVHGLHLLGSGSGLRWSVAVRLGAAACGEDHGHCAGGRPACCRSLGRHARLCEGSKVGTTVADYALPRWLRKGFAGGALQRSAPSGGVVGGGSRCRVACSYAYAIASRFGSDQAAPRS